MTAISNPNWVQALTYAASDDRAVLRALFAAAGVTSLSNMSVVQNGTPNMSVNVGSGQAIVARTSSSPADFYVVESPNAATNLTLAASDPTNPRIDIVVATVNDAQYAGGTNNAVLQIITGTPAGSPVQPTTPNNSLLLASIAVAASATTIINANITDKRTLFQEAGGVYSTIVFTSNGSLTQQQAAGARALRIEGCNGGGGGGGAAATGASQSAMGGPGGGGAGAIKTVSTSGLVFPLQINVGAAGTSGAIGGAGGVGGQSSVITNNGAGSTIWTPGAQKAAQAGGAGAASGTVGDASTAGFDTTTTGAVCDVAIFPPPPNNPCRVAAAVITRLAGGPSPFGIGGTPGNGTAGGAGVQGGGGGPGYVGASVAGQAGGAGGPGLVMVTLLF